MLRVARARDTKFELQARIVRTNPYRPIKESVVADRTFPDERVVGKDSQLIAIHFRPEVVRVTGTQKWDGSAPLRLDIAIAAIAALCAGMLAGIALHGNYELRFRFDAPHRVNQIASILGAEFKAKLAAEFSGTETRFISS